MIYLSHTQEQRFADELKLFPLDWFTVITYSQPDFTTGQEAEWTFGFSSDAKLDKGQILDAFEQFKKLKQK